MHKMSSTIVDDSIEFGIVYTISFQYTGKWLCHRSDSILVPPCMQQQIQLLAASRVHPRGMEVLINHSNGQHLIGDFVDRQNGNSDEFRFYLHLKQFTLDSVLKVPATDIIRTIIITNKKDW